ncbi:heavy metal-associated domain-containing protein [Devosia sp.]|uniref:cation transporter n=1 Tax=Devosia sp. TaxID=1871048 RepID=UPI001A082517|nr:heavy metal-associated domain-containing protein [Devosia sp.]MBE0581914.1 heavy-metal-associated domain-containing protein [Devosia sp.]
MTRAEKLTFAITGMGCVDCVAAIENAVMPMDGVEYVGVSLSLMTMTVRPGPGFDLAAIASRVRLLGFGVDEEMKYDAAPRSGCPCRVNSRRPVDNSS